MKLSNRLKKINILFFVKTGVGSAIAIFVASWLGLAFSPSAGIITLLTIQNTKKETVFIAIKRILAFVLANVIALLLFSGIGYTAVAFGAFIFVFAVSCTALGLQDGISMNSVLMTHYLIEQRMDLPLILNEIGLLIIGMVIGIALNLIMPRTKEQIRREQKKVEEDIKTILRQLAYALKNMVSNQQQAHWSRLISNTKSENNELDIHFNQLNTKLELLLKKVYMEAGNRLFSDTKYMVSYLEMRRLQINVLMDIKDKINQIPIILDQSYPIAEFMEKTADSFHELNNVIGLLEELDQLYQYFKKEELPKTREEFEYRAILFQILKEIEYFLLIKRDFVQEIEDKGMKSYWIA